MKRFRIFALVCCLVWLATTALADTHYWTPNTTPRTQKDTIEITGTWAATNTLTVSCGLNKGEQMVMTCGATCDTTSEVAAALAEVLMEATHDDSAITADVTINVGGRELATFYDFRAYVDPSDSDVVVIESEVPGVDFDIDAAAAGGSASLTLTEEVQAATGPEHWDATTNWTSTGGGVPANDDTVVFNAGAFGPKYGIGSIATGLDVVVGQEYAGTWGLPKINTSNGKPYDEYRDQKIELDNTATTGSQAIQIGTLNSTMQPKYRLRIDLGTNDGSQQVVTVFDAPGFSTAGEAIEISGGVEPSLVVYSGSVVLNKYADDTAMTITGLQMQPGGREKSYVRVTENVALSGSFAQVFAHNGKLIFDAGSGFATDLQAYAGAEVYMTCSTAPDDIIVRDGAVVYGDSGAADLWVYGGGKFYIRNSSASLTNVYLSKGFYYEDSVGVLPSGGYEFSECRVSDGTFIVPANLVFTPSTP